MPLTGIPFPALLSLLPAPALATGHPPEEGVPCADRKYRVEDIGVAGRPLYPNVLKFADGPGCVVETCVEPYVKVHLPYLLRFPLPESEIGGFVCEPKESPRCSNTCNKQPARQDFECQDGGPGSYSDHCGLGTDCRDCGERFLLGCKNKSELIHGAKDSQCIDCERPFAATFENTEGCAIKDCVDGFTLRDRKRVRDRICDKHPEGPGCAHTCRFRDNGRCDDGGPGAVSKKCDFGTDCADCGVREEPTCKNKEEFVVRVTGGLVEAPSIYRGPQSDRLYVCIPCTRPHAVEFADGPGCVITTCKTGYFPHDNGRICLNFPETPGCSVSCPYSANGDCNDGGSGGFNYLGIYMDELCEFGTDCADCGTREVPTCRNNEEPVVVVGVDGVTRKFACPTATVTVCETGHEIIDDESCVACRVSGARTYVEGKGCLVETCLFGYDPNNAKTACRRRRRCRYVLSYYRRNGRYYRYYRLVCDRSRRISEVSSQNSTPALSDNSCVVGTVPCTTFYPIMCFVAAVVVGVALASVYAVKVKTHVASHQTTAEGKL